MGTICAEALPWKELTGVEGREAQWGWGCKLLRGGEGWRGKAMRVLKEGNSIRRAIQ